MYIMIGQAGTVGFYCQRCAGLAWVIAQMEKGREREEEREGERKMEREREGRGVGEDQGIAGERGEEGERIGQRLS